MCDEGPYLAETSRFEVDVGSIWVTGLRGIALEI